MDWTSRVLESHVAFVYFLFAEFFFFLINRLNRLGIYIVRVTLEPSPKTRAYFVKTEYTKVQPGKARQAAEQSETFFPAVSRRQTY